MTYKRFTEIANHAMQFAEDEARRFNYKYVRTEHILIGILNDRSSGACFILESFGCKRDDVQQEVYRHIQQQPETDDSIRGLPLNPFAKEAIQYAVIEARGLNHKLVGTEHLLVGLLRVADDDDIASTVLAGFGLKLEEVRKWVAGKIESEPEIKLGSTVKLKSGGPLMTITYFSKNSDPVSSWFCGTELFQRSFPVSSLVPEEPND